MRFLIADALNGACFAAVVVLVAGHVQVAGTAVGAHKGIERSQPQVQPSTRDISQQAERGRDLSASEGNDQPPAAIKSASIIADAHQPKSEAVSPVRLPSFARAEPKAMEG